MRFITEFVLIGLLAGCRGHSDREPLMQFLQAFEGSLKHRHDDQLRGYPEDERKIRWHTLFFRDQVVAIDDYLSKRPPLTKRGRDLVDAVRQICVQEEELYERLLKEKRFQPTEAEQQRASELQADLRDKLAMIGRIVDGE
jgi:RecG-like helicase